MIECVAGVHTALDAVHSLTLPALGETEIRAAAGDLIRASDRLAAQIARLLAEIAAREAGPDGPVVGVADRVSGALLPAPVGGAERGRLARRAHAVSGLPLVSGLLAEGGVSTAVLDPAAAGLPRLPTDAWPTLDAVVSEQAHAITPDKVRALVEQLRVMSLPDAVDKRAAATARDRGVWLSQTTVGADQDGWTLRGSLHGLVGDQIVALINAYARPDDGDDPRSPAQRRHDGLAQICRIAARATGATIPGNAIPGGEAPGGGAPGEPGSGAGLDVTRHPRHGMDAHVLVIATAQTWRGDPGAPAAMTSTGSVLDPGQLAALRCDARPDVLIVAPPPPSGAHEPPQASGATPSPSHARASASPSADFAVAGDFPAPSDAELVRNLLRGLVPGLGGAALMPLAFGRSQRFANTPQWLSLVARDGGCVTPGCGRDESWTQAHHLLEWTADGGLTDLDELALLCFSCHPDLHRRGQHLHPPWCGCQLCHAENLALPDGVAPPWRVRDHPPVIARGRLPQAGGTDVWSARPQAAGRPKRGARGTSVRADRDRARPPGAGRLAKRSGPAGVGAGAVVGAGIAISPDHDQRD